MKFFNTLLSIILLIALSVPVFSQNDSDYKVRAQKVREEIWNWDIPAFKNRDIPDSLSGEPAVILARHQEIKAVSKNKFKFLVITAAKYKEIYLTNTYREMVKINDKATLDEYSELSYQKYKRLFRFFSRKLAGRVTIIGVRIFKPDGSMKELDISEEVLTTDTRNEQQNKIAISGLEVGDILDYFVSQHDEEEVGSRVEPYVFIMGDDKPVLHYSVHCEIGSTCAVEYRAMNGAPGFKVRKDAEGDNILDVEMKNLAKAPVDLWMSPLRQLPILRMNIRVGGSRRIRKKEGEVYKNPDYQSVIEEVKVDMKDDFTFNQMQMASRAYANEMNAMIKRARKNDMVTKDSLPYYVYYAFRYWVFYKVSPKDKIVVGAERNFQAADSKRFLLMLSLILQKLNIDNEIILATSVYGPDSKQVILTGDFDYIIKTTEGKPIYMSAEGVFTHCNYIPAANEGQQSPVLTPNAVNANNLKLRDEALQRLPATTFSKNVQIEKLRIKLSENMEDLQVNRETILKGHLRTGEQKRLLLFEDYYESERKALAIKESFMEEFADSRKNKALADEYTAAFAKARKEQKDHFINEVTSQFSSKPKELKEYEITNMALRHDKPDLTYHTSFVIENWIKRGGNNYIIDIGKLIGEQLELKPEQLKRNVDIYMPFARSFEFIISLEIPEGYTVEGVEKLIGNVSNETGKFITEARVEGNTLGLKVTKVYSHAFEKAAKWDQLTAIINAAGEFYSSKILLRKK
ncbi:MAG: DUF3857 domain-containing protein [Chitinophagaceae bacterium]|nr:DUF3857 domain-containing protein [Chitinophagaceae bacterium]MCW5927942.1 DUF3857 domain-containing protein [Chitinophagaceae bacterium]